MSSYTPVASGIFIGLLKAFAEHTQIPGTIEDDALGISFETESYSVRVLPHPELSEQLLIEVDICEANPATATSQALALVHRINYAARFEHGWIAAIDPDGRLVLFMTRAIASTAPDELEALIAQGLEKSEALQILWDNGSAETVPANPQPDTFDPTSVQNIRG